MTQTVYAELKWEQDVIAITANETDANAVFLFKFVNAGSDQVSIIGIRPECSCTVVKLTKYNYAPNESGEIAVVLSIGERTGTGEKSVDVITLSSSGEERKRLKVNHSLMEVLHCSPRGLSWTSADGGRGKTVKIDTAGPDIKSLNIVVVDKSPSFSTRVEPVQPNRSYLLHVTPLQGAELSGQSLEVVVDFVNGKQKRLTIPVNGCIDANCSLHQHK